MYRVSIWGLRAAGKSWFLAALVNTGGGGIIAGDEDSLRYIHNIWTIIQNNARIVAHKRNSMNGVYAPTVTPTRVKILIKPRYFNISTNKDVEIVLSDIKGDDYREMNKNFRDYIKKSNIIVIILDPNDIRNQIDHMVEALNKFKNELKKLHGVIFVFSKSDLIPEELMSDKLYELREYAKFILSFLHTHKIPYEVRFTSAVGNVNDGTPSPTGMKEFVDTLLRMLFYRNKK